MLAQLAALSRGQHGNSCRQRITPSSGIATPINRSPLQPECSILGSISRTLRQPLDFRKLFKLRLVVAAMGETQRLGWWNSGVLTGTGEFLFQQGFPRSAPFAQIRAGSGWPSWPAMRPWRSSPPRADRSPATCFG